MASDNTDDVNLNRTTVDSSIKMDLKSSSDEESEDEILPAWEEIKQTWALTTSSRMVKVIPLMIWTSTSLSIYQASFAPLMTMQMPSDWSDEE